MEKKETKRGGFREGAGRPHKQKGVLRVRLNTSVNPKTLEMIDKERKQKNLSRGELIDKMYGYSL